MAGVEEEQEEEADEEDEEEEADGEDEEEEEACGDVGREEEDGGEETEATSVLGLQHGGAKCTCRCAGTTALRLGGRKADRRATQRAILAALSSIEETRLAERRRLDFLKKKTLASFFSLSSHFSLFFFFPERALFFFRSSSSILSTHT